ncbi:aminotransferase class V-fold PLP-dependent enzyme [Demequina sp. NBRC 110056]|uniref:aminotransferase class V-fold PLP-dependent enzyme n=1 Tax=Demequina sp. NBRC 110056 TaxID=1570345 RepID=UPI000A042C4A|nr:aminotransferase class V-fold PLP-dependent enzyme [Demequina sp. NBRC 110056]
MLDPRIASAFDVPRGYLDTAAYGLPSRASAAALRAAADDWAGATLDPAAMDPVVDRIRAAYGAMIGLGAADVTIAGSVSQIVGLVAASLPPGARVLVAEGDFSSVPWPFQADPRLEVRAVPLDSLIDEVRPGVDLVAVSAVQSRDGRVLDLDALADAAHAAGARTLVDATQALPWLPIDARRLDVVVAAGYKWLTTPRGIAVAGVRDAGRWLRPAYASWYGADAPWDNLYGSAPALSGTARRLDCSPPWQLLESAALALELHARTDARAAFAHTTALADELRRAVGLRSAGSAIVSLEADARAVAAAGVRASARAGRVRLSFHVYNGARDLALAVDAVRAGLPVAA